MGEYICDECGGDLLPDACGCTEKRLEAEVEQLQAKIDAALEMGGREYWTAEVRVPRMVQILRGQR